MDRYATGPRSSGATFWIPGVKTEKTAKKRRKNEQKWARYSHLKRVRAALLCLRNRYSSDDKLTINKLLKLKPGMAVTDDILPVRAADPLGLLVSLSGLRCADGVAASRGRQARLGTRLS